jgi:hypothetical protein
MMSDLIFYPEAARDDLLDISRGMTPPPGWLERLTRSFTWTEPVGVNPCGIFIVNTMLNRRVYSNPKVVDIRGPYVTIEVLVDTDLSGTMRRLEVQYILIMPQGAIDEFERIAART